MILPKKETEFVFETPFEEEDNFDKEIFREDAHAHKDWNQSERTEELESLTINQYLLDLSGFLGSEESMVTQYLGCKTLDKKNKIWEPYTMSYLNRVEKNVWIPETDYIYYFYEVHYQDWFTQQGSNKKINFDNFNDKYQRLGIKAERISVYYGKPAKVTMRYILESHDGSTTLLLEEDKYGRHSVMVDDYEVKAETVRFNKIIKEYKVLNPMRIEFEEEDQTFDIFLQEK